MTFSLTGLLGHSAPGLATELDRTSIAAPLNNSLVPTAVPAAAAVEEATFETLSDAVAAQDADDQDEAIRCLAGAIYFESKGEPLSGQLAVANVIMNRASSGRFPSDVCGVVKQRGQFGFIRGGEIPAVSPDSRAYRTAVAVAHVAMSAYWDNPAPDALYFNTSNRRPGARLTKVAMIGNHVFYR